MSGNMPILLKRFVLSLLIAVSLCASGAHAQIVRDDTPGQTNIGAIEPVVNVITIDGADGISRGGGALILHSMSEFNVGANETARYTDSNDRNTARTILTRVIGNNGSDFLGRIESLYPNADLIFVNPNGVFYGAGFTLDVPQSFHSSTADFLDMSDGTRINFTGVGVTDPIPDFSVAVPYAWGFLDAGPSTNNIRVEGFSLDGIVNIGVPGQAAELSFIADNVEIVTDLQTNARSLIVVGVGTSGRVEGFDGEFGSAVDSVKTTSLLGGRVDIRGSIETGPRTLPPGATYDNGDIRILGRDVVLRVPNPSSPSTFSTSTAATNAGDILIVADNDLIIDPGAQFDISGDTESGSLGFFAGNLLTANEITVDTGASSTVEGRSTIQFVGDTVSLQGALIDGNILDGVAASLGVEGRIVDVSNSVVNITTNSSAEPLFGSAGSVYVRGSEELDITAALGDLRALGIGPGGDVQTVSLNNPIGSDSSNYVTNAGGRQIRTILGTPGNDIIRDTTPGQAPGPLPSTFDSVTGRNVYTIHGDDGVRRDNGRLVLHSFSDFDLTSDETALYTDTDLGLSTAEEILTRITGSRPSRLDGQIINNYADADLFFVNPNGVFFGSDFALDTRSFFVSTADRLELFDSVDGGTVSLNTATPIEVSPLLPGFNDALDEGGVEGARFLRDDVADITVEGFEFLNDDIDGDAELFFAAGNITFGTEDFPVNIETRGRDLIAIAIGGSGRIFDTFDVPGSSPPFIGVTDLNGNNINPTGVVSLSGSINTRGANGDVGEVFFLPNGSSELEEVSGTVDGLEQITSGDAFAESLIEEVEASDESGDLQQAQSKEKKHAQTPGVSLFTSTAQAAPMVPRTCESIASGDRKSKFLATTSKRLPVSPENWLIAFDTSGDELLAAAESAEPLTVGAIGSSGTNQEDLKRITRTQRAMASVAGAVRGGRFEDAAAGFESVASELEAAMDPQGASEVLVAYAQLQQNDGRFRGARLSLERALALAEPLGDAEYTAGIRTSLGNALIGTGDLVRAEDELTRGLNVVIASKNKQPAPSVLNNLGNRHAATRDFKSALWAYERSAKLAREIGRKGDEARALAGAARAALESGQLTNARMLLDQASPLVASLSEMRERVPLNIHMGRTFALLAAMSPAGRAASLLSAFESYDAALKGAEQLGDLRAVALANLNLGALYRDEQHRSEALYLTRLAQRAAEGINAPELLYRAHWQEGQILWSEHQVGPALAAHRRAVEILEDTKPVASDGYGSTDASFRMAVGGVYQDTVDLLLRTSSMVESERESDLLIAEARETLEKLKGAELRDYFEDECIASVGSTGRGIDNLGESAAVVYTVTLPDRVEMLVGLPDGIERFTTKVSAARLNKSIDDFRVAVQNPLTNAHQALGKQLHNWIVAPYAERLDEEGIETLVFIADGRLRTLPFAALSDSEDRYVGERFATATALSLRLLSPPEIVSERGRPVLAGLSESVQGFSELAAVPDELAQIKLIEGGDLLLNEAFTLDEIRSAVQREIPGIVHLATHAVFTGNPDTSFLLTHGGRVGFDDLSDVVGMTQADGAPLDLLVLSACETAVGNDRAGLGFTGSAIRSGARSAMGSLWPISDTAARTLMIDFYKGLNAPELNKAEALQKAQATLRDSERFAHPFYWAPFTLVNDWM